MMAESNEEVNYDDDVNENAENEEFENQEQEQEFDPEEFKRLKEEFERTKSYLEKANREAKDRRLKLREYEEAGMSPEEIKELREKQEKQKFREMERKGEWEKLKSQLTETYQQELSKKDEELQKMRQSMERNLVDREVTAAIAKHDGIDLFLRPHVRESVKLVEDDNGNLVPRVVDSDGSPKFNSKGDYMGVDEFVASLREHEEFGLAFKGRGQSGAGTKSAATNGNKPIPKKKRSDMSMDEKRAFMKEYGIDEYERLPL